MVIDPVDGSFGVKGGGEFAIGDESDSRDDSVVCMSAFELWCRKALTRPEIGAICDRRSESSEVRM